MVKLNKAIVPFEVPCQQLQTFAANINIESLSFFFLGKIVGGQPKIVQF